MRLTKFGTTDLPELNGVHGLSQTARTNILPLKYGGIDLDGNEAVLNIKQITASAVINEDLDDTMDDLAYEAQKGTRVLKAQMRDNTERQLLAKMSVFSRNAKADKYTCEQEYGFQWNAMYPYWLATEDEPYYSSHGLTTGDGLNTGSGLGRQANAITTSSVTFTLTNNSRVRIPKVKFVLRGGGATTDSWSNIKITNITNGYYVQVNRTITMNTDIVRQFIHINCLNKKVFGAYADNATNKAEYNLYNYVVTNPEKLDWMILEPGVNTIVVTSTLSGASMSRAVISYWSRHYV